MRAFTLALALILPVGLAACNAEPEQPEAVEDYQEEVQGPVEEELDQELTGTFGTYDTDADLRISEAEYDTGIGDGLFTDYDTDADGYLTEEEFSVYDRDGGL